MFWQEITTLYLFWLTHSFCTFVDSLQNGQLRRSLSIDKLLLQLLEHPLSCPKSHVSPKTCDVEYQQSETHFFKLDIGSDESQRRPPTIVPNLSLSTTLERPSIHQPEDFKRDLWSRPCHDE